jgi:hypothetical protein
MKMISSKQLGHPVQRGTIVFLLLLLLRLLLHLILLTAGDAATGNHFTNCRFSVERWRRTLN